MPANFAMSPGMKCSKYECLQEWNVPSKYPLLTIITLLTYQSLHDVLEIEVLPICGFMHLSSAFLGRGTPGLPGGNQLKLKKSAPQYRGLPSLLVLFLAEDWGHFQASVGGCHCHPLSHCLSDLPRVETLLSDHARRFGELSNFNLKSCDSSRYPRGLPSRESRWQVHYHRNTVRVSNT